MNKLIKNIWKETREYYQARALKDKQYPKTKIKIDKEDQEGDKRYYPDKSLKKRGYPIQIKHRKQK